MLSDDWWFWVSVACVLALGTAGSARYRAFTAGLRARALSRRLVEPGSGRRIDTRPGGFWSDTSWLLLLVGAWVALSPWIWGYHGAPGAIATDVITGGAVIALTAAGILFPSFNALTVLVGTWLVLAPWVVGYGDERGPVGLSDTIAGVLISALAIAELSSAGKRVVAGATMPVGRVRRRSEGERRR
jgi:hypothetical protein